MIHEIQSFGDNINWDFEADRRVKENINLFPPAFDRVDILNKYKKGGKLIDCGCNIGRYIKAVENAGYTYTGVDQSAHALDIARNYHPDGNFIHSFLWDMKFKYKFDIVFINAVLQHNTLTEKKHILESIVKITKKGSIFTIAESTVLVETATQLTHDGWINLIESFGFTLLETLHENEFGLKDNYIFKKV